jgi:hypothetical protein
VRLGFHLYSLLIPDVNDLGVEIGNGGSGLMTVQARGVLPIINRVRLHLAGGIFRANKPRSSPEFNSPGNNGDRLDSFEDDPRP